jgi:hypothetical protein
LRAHIGAEDYAYYEHQPGIFPWGWLLFVIPIGFLFARLWLISAALYAVWLIYLFVRIRVRAADRRYQDIAQRIEAFDDQFPPFIYVLHRVAERGDLQGGWHDLN